MKKFFILFVLLVFPSFMFAEQHDRSFVNVGFSYEFSKTPTSILGLNFDISLPFNNITFMGIKGDFGLPMDDQSNPSKRFSVGLYTGLNYTLLDCIRLSAYPILEYQLPLKKTASFGGLYGGAGCSLEVMLNDLDIFNLGYEYMYSLKNMTPTHRWYLEISFISYLELLISNL
ncbi:MAG: hypothetical protein MJ162_01830 [Treponema sp.]|nr:hypothetical protein [Treponema sp.]